MKAGNEGKWSKEITCSKGAASSVRISPNLSRYSPVGDDNLILF